MSGAAMLWATLVLMVVLVVTGEAWPWGAAPRFSVWRPPEAIPTPRGPYSPHSALHSAPHGVSHAHQLRGAPPLGFLSSITRLLDPLSIFSNKGEAKVGAPGKWEKGEGQDASHTAPEAPIVYFPEGHNGQCQDFAPAGFNVYSFLSFMFAVANLVGLVANNVNNNINSNNNNDNNNNNNLDNINAANSNSNINNDNTVNVPAKRRRRRRRTQWIKNGEEEMSLITMDFVKGLRTAMVVSDAACALRNLCEMNRAVVGRGEAGIVLAEVLSLAFVEWYPRHPPPTGDMALISAAMGGRRGYDCSAAHPHCPDTSWRHHISLLDLVKNPTEDTHLTQTLTGEGSLGSRDLKHLNATRS